MQSNHGPPGFVRIHKAHIPVTTARPDHGHALLRSKVGARRTRLALMHLRDPTSPTSRIKRFAQAVAHIVLDSQKTRNGLPRSLVGRPATAATTATRPPSLPATNVEARVVAEVMPKAKAEAKALPRPQARAPPHHGWREQNTTQNQSLLAARRHHLVH